MLTEHSQVKTAGVTVNFVHSRNEGLGTDDDFAIAGKGLMLRRANEPSSVEFVIPNGVGTFTFSYRKAFTAGTNTRVLAVVVDGVETTVIPAFGAAGNDPNVYTSTTTINKPGSVSVKITYPAGTSTGNRQITIDNVSWTAGSSQPSLSTSTAALDFGITTVGTTSALQTVQVNASNLTSAPTYTVSGTDAAMFSATGTLTATGGSMDVTFSPTSEGAKSAVLTITSGSLTSTVNLSGTAPSTSNPYALSTASPLGSLAEDFESATVNTSTMPSGWTNVAVMGDRLWDIKTFSNNQYAQMSSFSGTGSYNTLLISPAVNLDAIIKNNVTFDWNSGYANGADLNVYVIQLVNGVMQQTQVHSINDTTNSGGYGAAFNTVTLDLSAFTGVGFLAFEYVGTAGITTTTYQVDNVNMPANALGVADINTVKGKFVKNTNVQEEIQFGSKSDVKVYNMNGQVVKSASVSENKNLFVADLQPGMYIVTGSVNGQPVSQKILKK